jgi:hypothetical protein
MGPNVGLEALKTTEAELDQEPNAMKGSQDPGAPIGSVEDSTALVRRVLRK